MTEQVSILGDVMATLIDVFFSSLVSNRFVFFIAIEDEKVTLKFKEWIIGSFLN